MIRSGCLLVLLSAVAAGAYAGEWSGYLSAELRGFNQSGLDPRQDDLGLSLAAQPEYYHRWDDDRQSFTFVPFLRWDQDNTRRTHLDIRELTWQRTAEHWELRVGIRKLFWGVTESVHLVDIVNQTDLVENLDGEDKFGQPMLNLALVRDWGTVDLFLLPGFRPRSFPGPDGRLRTQPVVDVHHPLYESDRGVRHIDWALRWGHSTGEWDIGLSHFSGTSREPRLVPTLRAGTLPILQPYYGQIDQTGLDLQATLDAWLWKLECISRGTDQGRYTALAGGFEYTLYGIGDGDTDLGLLAEYLFDDRGNRATTPFQNDLFIGARLTLNDAQSSELLAGLIFDLDGDTRFYSLEASRRIGQDWKLALEARGVAGTSPNDPLAFLRRDAYVQAELAWYF